MSTVRPTTVDVDAGQAFEPSSFEVQDGQCRFSLFGVGEWFDCKIRQTAAAIYRSLEEAIVFVPAMFAAGVLRSANALAALPGPMRAASYGDWLLRTWSVTLYLALGVFAAGLVFTALRLFTGRAEEGPVGAGRRFVALLAGLAMAAASFTAMDYLTLVAQQVTVATTEDSCPWRGQTITVEVPAADGSTAPATATVAGDDLCRTEWVSPRWPVLTYLASWAPPVGPGGGVWAGSAPHSAALAFARNLLDGCDQSQRLCPGGRDVPPGGLGWTLLALVLLIVLGFVGVFWQLMRIYLVATGPLYCTYAVIARAGAEGLWGYWHLVLRTVMVPIPVLAILAAARAAAGPAADVVSPVVVSCGALLVLDALLLKLYVLPCIAAVRASPVTLAGGTVRAKVQEYGSKARAAVEGLGIAFGSDRLVRAARSPGQAAAAAQKGLAPVVDAARAVGEAVRDPVGAMRRTTIGKSVEAAADPRAALERVRARVNDPADGWWAVQKIEHDGLYHAAFTRLPDELAPRAARMLALHGIKTDWGRTDDARRVLVVPLKSGDQAAQILSAELSWSPYWAHKGQYVVLDEEGLRLSPEPPEDGVYLGAWSDWGK